MRLIGSVLMSAVLLHAVPTAAQVVHIDPPTGPGAMAPNVATDGEAVLLTWLEPASTRDGHKRKALRFARFDGEAWSDASTIIERDDFFANWADVPGAVATNGTTLTAWWLQKSASATYAYHIHLARSTDKGKSWNEIGRLHEDTTPTEHGFVAAIAAGDATRLFWLDGREMATGGHGDGSGGAMTLRTSLVGSTAGPSQVLDAKVCECCGTSATLAGDVPIIVYRDRSDSEVRDISVVRFADGHWSEPVSVHDDGWKINGCPVNGPAIDAVDNDVVVAWLTAPTGSGEVYVAFSDDAAAGFGPAIQVATGKVFGRVDVVMLEDGSAVVSWLGNNGEETAIMMQRANATGMIGKPQVITPTSAARASGFPKLVSQGDSLLAVWTDVEEPGNIRAARVEFEQSSPARPG